MLHLVQLSQFKRDIKRCIKRNKDMSKLRELISMLIYKVDDNTLYLVRTGTHADIF